MENIIQQEQKKIHTTEIEKVKEDIFMNTAID